MVGNPLLNPFTALLSTGTILPTGREERLAEIAGIISQEQHENRDLHGLPNVGKSALLRQIVGDQFLSPLHEQFLEPYRSNPQRLFILYVSGWIESIHPIILIYREYYRRFQAYQAWIRKVDREFMESGLPSLAEPVEGASLDTKQALDLLESHLWALRDTGIRVVLLLDDFDSQWAFGKLSVDEAARVNSWRDYFSLICTTERRLEDVNREARRKMSPLFKRITPRIIGGLSSDGAARFVRVALGPARDKLHEDDVQLLIDLSGGFPLLLLLGGQALWELRDRLNLLESPDKPLPEPMRAFLRARLAQAFSRTFHSYYESLSAEQQERLLEMARGGPVPIDTLSDDEVYVEHLSWLENYGLVRIIDGKVELFSPLFRDFLLETAAAPTEVGAERAPELPRQQADLYDTFRRRPGEPLSYAELGQAVWEWPAGRPAEEIDEAEKAKIQLAVHKLRAELERSGRGERIVNVRKRGYRYEPAL